MEKEIKICQLKKEIEKLKKDRFRPQNTEDARIAIDKMVKFKENRILELSLQ